MYKHILLLLVLQFSALCLAQGDAKAKCERSGESCAKCIRADPLCSWCGEIVTDPYKAPATRCRLHSDNLKLCSNASIAISNPASNVAYTSDEDFSEIGSGFFEKGEDIDQSIIQMKPQNVRIRLRKGETVKVNVTFKKLVDFPLDIYYVMDLSLSMEDDLEKLKESSAEFIKNVEKDITDNVQIGFGSFVDKVLNPFTSTEESDLENPCSEEKKCAPPFGFRHQLSITGNSSAFVETINRTRISANIDAPEGSFDALMQIAVCEEIGWRKGSTRMVLLTTDDTPHFALDGKQAAILQVNDMKCHLEKGAHESYPDDSIYTKSKFMDYPSLGQLRKVFRSNRINSIFAVIDDVYPLYKGIENVLPNSYVVALADDSSNIQDVIAEAYGKFNESLNFGINERLPAGLNLKQYVTCPGEERKSELRCGTVKNDDEIFIEFEFSLTDCPSNPNKVDQFKLTSSTFPDEVVFNIEYICECDCQSKPETKSDACNNNGTLRCGECECDDTNDGYLCQCSSEEKELCKVPNSDDKLCNGHGTCECGSCISCDPNYIGTYCECQTTGCPAVGGKECGGPDRGWCSNCPGNTTCHCYAPYTNNTDGTCTCQPDKCKQGSSNVKCNGRGYCDCDKCVCNEAELWGGDFCQKCQHPNCTEVDYTCEGVEIQTCAECTNKGSVCPQSCYSSTWIRYMTVQNFPDCTKDCPEGSEETDCKRCAEHTNLNVTTCKKYHGDQNHENYQCAYTYQIVWNVDFQFQVYINESVTECPEPINLAVVLPVAVGIPFLIAILTIIAYVQYLNLKEKRHYKAHMDELKKAKWHNAASGMYREPVQRTRNPTFIGEE